MSGSDAGANKMENAAAAEFARYKARMAEAQMPVMMPMMMAGSGMPNWAVPPSLATFGAPVQPAGGDARSIGEGLGSTVRLGIELLNAFLASSAGALGGATMMYGREEGRSGCGCHCGTDCCAAFGCHCCEHYACCEPGISGCCR